VYDAATDTIGWAADYKKTGIVYEFSPDGSVVRTWRLEGCWPSSVAFGEFSNDGADKKTITITVTYDKAFREM
jgi:sugar lactone lactonase YvrE